MLSRLIVDRDGAMSQDAEKIEGLFESAATKNGFEERLAILEQVERMTQATALGTRVAILNELNRQSKDKIVSLLTLPVKCLKTKIIL